MAPASREAQLAPLAGNLARRRPHEASANLAKAIKAANKWPLGHSVDIEPGEVSLSRRSWRFLDSAGLPIRSTSRGWHKFDAKQIELTVVPACWLSLRWFIQAFETLSEMVDFIISQLGRKYTASTHFYYH